MKKIAVLLADDHTVVRQGLRALLEAEDDMAVVGEAENGRAAVVLAEKSLPDLVLMDLSMPELNGLEATRWIVRNIPSVRVLVLTSYGETEYMAQLKGAGASGFVVKQSAAEHLLNAIREVRAGRTFFRPSVATPLWQQDREAARSGQSVPKANRLTSREAQVLQLIAKGCANKQVADKMSISIKTVEKHRQQVMDKLNIHEAAGLTRYAISKGLVEHDGANSDVRL